MFEVLGCFLRVVAFKEEVTESTHSYHMLGVDGEASLEIHRSSLKIKFLEVNNSDLTKSLIIVLIMLNDKVVML